MSTPDVESDLASVVERGLKDFCQAAQAAFGDALVSVVLFGSAAEGRLRPTSDVNVVVVVKTFERSAADNLLEGMRVGHAVMRLGCMFLLESEIAAATEAFATKFADIAQRRRVLVGVDVFDQLTVPRGALIARLRQVLLNLQLSLREKYVSRALRAEQLALAIADAAAPLRTSAATLLSLEGAEKLPPKEALERVVAGLNRPNIGSAIALISRARQREFFDAKTVGDALFALLELTAHLRKRAEVLT